jgi:ABC-type transport system involved in multi-copper enzyme maturation permease subunit
MTTTSSGREEPSASEAPQFARVSWPMSTALARDHHTRSNPIWLVKAEFMKVRTTNTWWLFGIGVILFTLLALLRNGAQHHFILHPPASVTGSERAQLLAQAAQARTYAGHVAVAADMMTSGQFFGVLFAMLIGILVVTNEYFHQTATATFMTTPHRGAVIMAKLAAAGGFGVLFWLACTVLDLIVTPFYLRAEGINVALTDWIVVRSVLLNLLAFAMWAVFGLGLGTLVRSQIGAVVTGMAVYLAGAAAVELIFNLIYLAYHHTWVLSAAVIAPAIASLVMTTPGSAFEHAPPQWVGLLVMIGYSLTFGLIGLVLTRRRDIT